MTITIRTKEKILVHGDFQTGKSTLARHVLENVPRWHIFDPACMHEGGTTNMDQAFAQFQQHGRAVYWPGFQDISLKFDEWCKRMVMSDNAMAFIDEPAFVMSPMGNLPEYFSALYRLGHKRGVGVMLASHRFHGDLPALTRIHDHMFVFRMSVDIDVMNLRGFIGNDGAQWVRTAPDYHFWYRNARGDSFPCTPVPLRQPVSTPDPVPGAGASQQESQ